MRMVDGIIVIKDGFYNEIVDGRNRRAVETTLSKHPDEQFEWMRDYVRVAAVSVAKRRLSRAV